MSRATWCRYGKPDKPGKPSPKLRGAVSKEEQEERRKRLTYAVQLVCEKYKKRKLIFSLTVIVRANHVLSLISLGAPQNSVRLRQRGNS